MYHQIRRLVPLAAAAMIATGGVVATAMERPPENMPGKDSCEQGGPVGSNTGKHLQKSPKEVEKYWTKERMRNARPMNMNVPVNRKKTRKPPCGK